MSRDQVVALLGPPAGVQSLAGFDFLDWKTPELVIRVTFKNGVVQKKVARDPRIPVEEPAPVEPIEPANQIVPGGANFQVPEMRDD